MKELQRRVAALEQLMIPEVDYVELCGYAARQLEAMDFNKPFPEPPEGLAKRCPPGYAHCVFLWGRNETEWNETMAKRDAEIAKMISMVSEARP